MRKAFPNVKLYRLWRMPSKRPFQTTMEVSMFGKEVNLLVKMQEEDPASFIVTLDASELLMVSGTGLPTDQNTL